MNKFIYADLQFYYALWGGCSPFHVCFGDRCAGADGRFMGSQCQQALETDIVCQQGTQGNIALET